MKIQPVLDVNSQPPVSIPVRPEQPKPAVLKSRLKRLFDRQFPSVLKISSAVEKPSVAGDGVEFEPNSVCLAKMVQNYIEDSNDNKPLRVRHRCNCFNGNGNESSDDELEFFSGGGFESINYSNNNGSSLDASEILKSLIPCTSVTERNLLADTAMIVDKNKNNHKQKHEMRSAVVDGLSSVGYNSSICKSKWDKSPSFPAGEYEYIDVVIEGERLLIDVEFKSEFEIARSTSAYKSILQSLPFIFVGKPDRLSQIVMVVSEAAKQSLKKKGMHLPPWRKAEYMRAKWLSPSFIRVNDNVLKENCETETERKSEGYSELIFGEEKTSTTSLDVWTPERKSEGDSELIFAEETTSLEVWTPPFLRAKSQERTKIVTGLASLLNERP